jgi:putative aldouronate transport system permease protein
MLYAMLALPLAFFVIFRYIPMTNIVIAFKEYNMFRTVWSAPWVGWKWFSKALGTADFFNALRNTVTLNLLDLAVGFPAPIMLAILLNELAYRRFKKLTQTVVYLPHFLSWIIISGLALQLFAPNTGLVNMALAKIGRAPIHFLDSSRGWVPTYIGLGLWQSVGWNTIIYLAAITGISTELYEAAEVDGASRLRKIWHVTLPGLRPTIVTLLIMSLGRILGSEFDRPYAMRNSLVTDVADVISTYVYRVGIRSNQFSLASAVGLFQSVVCVFFLVIANSIARRSGERGIW